MNINLTVKVHAALMSVALFLISQKMAIDTCNASSGTFSGQSGINLY